MRPSIGIALCVLASTACAGQPAPQDPSPERPWQEITEQYASSRLVRPRGSPSEASLAQELGLRLEGQNDSTIAQLLAHRLTLPGQISIGVLHMPPARSVPAWYSREPALTFGPAVQDSALAAASRLARVRRAVPLPALVLNGQPSVGSLREAAARLQVDVVLVYRPTCLLFERYPFIGSITYRASCTLEAIAIDVRSGIFPYAAAVTRDVTDRRLRQDMEPAGAIVRIATAASASAMADFVIGFASILSAIPRAEP